MLLKNVVKFFATFSELLPNTAASVDLLVLISFHTN